MNTVRPRAASAGLATTARMLRLAGAVVALALAAACASPTAPPAPRAVAPPPAQPQAWVETLPRHADFSGLRASLPARQLAQWVLDSGDHQGHGFAIVDKKDARVFVFGSSGKLQGASPVLLGAARGDDSVPGIGDRPIAQVRPNERTTPAGRFLAEPGFNIHGEDILWVDYDAAVSMHRLRTVNLAERRAQRLASPRPDDNRISYGCINVPPAFYDQILRPLFSTGNGVVYILPDTRPLRQVFNFPAIHPKPHRIAGASPVAGGPPQRRR